MRRMRGGRRSAARRRVRRVACRRGSSRTAHALTSAIAAAGASGRVRCAAAKITANGSPAVRPSTSAPSGGERERAAEREQERADRRADEGGSDERGDRARVRRGGLRRAGDDADEEDEAAGEPCGGRARALALEQRDDPVPRDHREPERRGLQDADREQRAVAERPTLRRARRAGGPCAASVGRAARTASSAALQYGRAPARRVGERRHDHEREPAARHRRAAVEALQRRASAARADEVEPGDERRRPSRCRRPRVRASASSKPASTRRSPLPTTAAAIATSATAASRSGPRRAPPAAARRGG